MSSPAPNLEEAINGAVDALHWLLHAPSLVSNEAIYPFAHVAISATTLKPWFTALRTQSSTRSAFIESIEPLLQQPPEHHRLGKFAERLIDFFLRNAPSELQLKHHATGVQRIERAGLTNRTVGELDFLLERNGKQLHWEMATKFYLFDPRLSHMNDGRNNALHCFVGPNRTDNLARKLRTLVDRQLPQSPPQPWPADGWQHEVLLKGWLFYPFGESLPPVAHSPEVNEAHLRGSWIEHRNARNLPDGQYIQLPRLRWLAHATRSSNDQSLTSAHIAAAEIQHPALYARVDSHGLEIDRTFVVPQSWMEEL
jgi:uncharacterized protein